MGRIKLASLNYTFKATTIVESMVAMVIIVLSFGIGMMIYMNVLTADQLSAKTKADILIQEELVQTKTEKRFFNERKEIEGILLEKEVIAYTGTKNAFTIILKAIDLKGNVIREVKETVYAINEKT